jgi:hypothetical protein
MIAEDAGNKLPDWVFKTLLKLDGKAGSGLPIVEQRKTTLLYS